MFKLCFVPLALILFASTALAEAGTITVNITEVSDKGGFIAIGLYSDKTVFPKRGKSLMSNDVEAVAGTTTYTFNNVPIPGEYAVAIFHDANSNKKFDKNFLGMPKEGYAFSNNARGTLGPPKWEKASFNAEKQDTTINIKMGY